MTRDELWRPLYPFRSQSLQLDGARYNYVDEGAGEVLLLVHGNPTWSFYWRNIITALSDRYRLVAVDHIGCGLSDKPQDYPYTLAQHTENLGQLVEQLDLKEITLLAHDWGGAIGLGTAAAMPERFARQVLFNTAAFPSTHFPLRIRVCRGPLLGRIAVQGLNLFARAALTMAVENHERMTPAVRAGLIAPYDSWQHRLAIYRFVKDVPGNSRHPTYAVVEELERSLARLADKPTLLIWGMRDWCFTPAFLERFLTYFPAAEVLRLDEAGHYVVEDAPEEIITRLQQFLSDHPVPEAEVQSHA